MTKGFVVPAGGGKRYEETPGRIFALKLLADQTGRSIMLFEETVPAGTRSTHHLHHDSDEVVWVLGLLGSRRKPRDDGATSPSPLRVSAAPAAAVAQRMNR